jgi:hypothetical protein
VKPPHTTCTLIWQIWQRKKNHRKLIVNLPASQQHNDPYTKRVTQNPTNVVVRWNFLFSSLLEFVSVSSLYQITNYYIQFFFFMSTMDAPLFLHFLAALISTIHECTGDDWISGTQSINLASVGPNRESLFLVGALLPTTVSMNVRIKLQRILRTSLLCLCLYRLYHQNFSNISF